MLFRICKSSKLWLNMMRTIRDCSLERGMQGKTCIIELGKVFLMSAAEWLLPILDGNAIRVISAWWVGAF